MTQLSSHGSQKFLRLGKTGPQEEYTLCRKTNLIQRGSAENLSRFAQRAHEPPVQRDLQLLLDFPFLRSTFDEIASAFLVNISIVRTLNKNQNAVFSRTRFKHVKCADPLICQSIHLAVNPAFLS